MSDYKSRDDVITEIKKFKGYLDDDMITRLTIAIDRIPSADVVEVVRCKDCKHWNKDVERNDGYGYCSYWQRFIAQAASEDIQTYKDVFCCYGERKEQEYGTSK